MTETLDDNTWVVVGLGKTGFSCVQYAVAVGQSVVVVDAAEEPKLLGKLKAMYPQVPFHGGSLRASWLRSASLMIVSPGIPPSTPEIKQALAAGVPRTCDIELFCQQAPAPVIGITGTNGKSTTTTLLGRMALESGLRVRMGGNLGEPVLPWLLESPADLYVVEISSYQLELCEHLPLHAAAFLNFSPDHLDRYPDLEAYRHAKQRVFRQANHCLWNKDDPETVPNRYQEGASIEAFSSGAPTDGCVWGLVEQEEGVWLARGDKRLVLATNWANDSAVNRQNALAAVALFSTLNRPLDSIKNVFKTFSSLPHRGDEVRHRHGIHWVNASKATNVASAQAAIQAWASVSSQLILICGGLVKGVDLSFLSPCLAEHVRVVILLGRDQRAWMDIVASNIQLALAVSMESAVEIAALLAADTATVLLAPACASQDMFDSAEHRGEVFSRCVEALR